MSGGAAGDFEYSGARLGLSPFLPLFVPPDLAAATDLTTRPSPTPPTRPRSGSGSGVAMDDLDLGAGPEVVTRRASFSVDARSPLSPVDRDQLEARG